jgi:hypothetical protein
VLLAVLVVTAPAAAEERASAPCDASAGPWIRFEGGQQPDALGFPEILRHVRAELERRGIQVCVEGRGEPVAVVAFEMGSESSVEVVVDVRDQVTRKRVSRTLDLHGIPRDARPLAVAVGTDELLAASWAEVALETPRETPAPPEIARVVSGKMREPERRADAALAVVYETYGGGQAFVGIDVRGGYRVFERLAFTGRLSLRRGFEEAAPNGTLESSAWGLGLGVRALLTPPSRALGADALARLDVLSTSYSPDGKAGAIEHPNQATAVVGTAGIGLRLEPTRALRLGLEGLVGTPFRSVTATDSGGTVSAVSGLALAFGGDVAFAF